MGMVKEDPIGPLVRAIADEVERRLMVHLSRLLSVEEAGIYLGRTAGAIRMMHKAGKLPAVKMDERVLFDVQDLDRVIETARLSKNTS